MPSTRLTGAPRSGRCLLISARASTTAPKSTKVRLTVFKPSPPVTSSAFTCRSMRTAERRQWSAAPPHAAPRGDPPPPPPPPRRRGPQPQRRRGTEPEAEARLHRRQPPHAEGEHEGDERTEVEQHDGEISEHLDHPLTETEVLRPIRQLVLPLRSAHHDLELDADEERHPQQPQHHRGATEDAVLGEEGRDAGRGERDDEHQEAGAAGRIEQRGAEAGGA